MPSNKNKIDSVQDYFFYCQKDIEKSITINQFYNEVYTKFNLICKQEKAPVYILNKVLSKSNSYSDDVEELLQNIVVVVSTNWNIMVLHNNLDTTNVEYFYDEFLDDIYSIVDKFNFTNSKCLGRKREWKDLIKIVKWDNTIDLDDFSIDTPSKRKTKILLSLIIDSINDAEKVCNDSQNLSKLGKIKTRIKIFDAEQTRFLYNEPKKATTPEIITIQGLSGSGKTELLLHKIKNIFENEVDKKVALVCHSKILANKLEHRIEDFFDYMGIRNRRNWQDRIFVSHAWGGLYKQICNFYQIPFLSYGKEPNFDKVSQKAIENLSTVTQTMYDYLLIDESQDLPESFFELCKKITSKKVYIVGDIFQDIYGNKIRTLTEVDFTLKECYRTNPRTLMMAQAVGLGLFEDNQIDCLEEDEWQSCGYEVIKNDECRYSLKRDDIRIFEEEESIKDSFEIIVTQRKITDIIEKLKTILERLKDDYSDIKNGDIAIIVMFKNKQSTYTIINSVKVLLSQMGVDFNISYEEGRHYENKLFITNQNNVKGLEFPFIICIGGDLKFEHLTMEELRFRNSLYMALTRSFVKSFWITAEDNVYLTPILKQLENIKENLSMDITIPSNCQEIKNRTIKIIEQTEVESYEDFLYTIFKELSLSKTQIATARTILINLDKFAKNRDKNEVVEFLKMGGVI